MSLSKLFAILIAAAMLFAPLAMLGGGAMAAIPSDHPAEMTGKDHCKGQPAADDGGMPADDPCCAAMCAASALPTRAGPDAVRFSRPLALPGAVTRYHGVLSEISTPPPRVA